MNFRALFCYSLAVCFGASGLVHAAQRPTAWRAAHTRVVVVSLAGFQGEKKGHTSFSTSDRLDDPLVGLLLQRGVPETHVLYLKDDDATTAAVTLVM